MLELMQTLLSVLGVGIALALVLFLFVYLMMKFFHLK
jgi:hypothetical protein